MRKREQEKQNELREHKKEREGKRERGKEKKAGGPTCIAQKKGRGGRHVVKNRIFLIYNKYQCIQRERKGGRAIGPNNH